MKDTPTPRTDAAYTQRPNEGAWDFKVRQEKTMESLERELTAAREEIERLKDHCRIKVKALINQTSERMKAEQQRDRLAEALERILDYQGRFAEEEPESIADEALKSIAPNK